MTCDINCKNDCIFYEYGKCRMGVSPLNSIFAEKKERCIYYHSKKKLAESTVFNTVSV